MMLVSCCGVLAADSVCLDRLAVSHAACAADDRLYDLVADDLFHGVEGALCRRSGVVAEAVDQLVDQRNLPVVERRRSLSDSVSR
jgi:hypothetical protein